jgi:hypothetical protein
VIHDGSSSLGMADDPFFFLISFIETADPESGNAFWNEKHHWLLAKLPNDISAWYWQGGDVEFTSGSFSLNQHDD